MTFVSMIALLLAGTVFAAAGEAAAERRLAVTGALDAWRGWHFATDTTTPGCFPPQKICVEAVVPAAPLAGRHGVRIPVAGRLVAEGGTLRMLELRQVEPVTLRLAGARGRLRIAGLKWRLAGRRLEQTGTAAAVCDRSATAACLAIANGLNDPDGADSPVDFDGIPDQFPIQLGALRLNYRPALAADLRDPHSISLDVASHSPAARPLSSLFNAATLAHFTLAEQD